MTPITAATQMPGAATRGVDARTLRDATDLDPLLDQIADARFVLLGEASHGTHEYYAWRTEITRRLVTERDFSFVAVEGDWPDCYAVNRCVKLADDAAQEPLDVLDGFQRWPTWMWANAEQNAAVAAGAERYYRAMVRGGGASWNVRDEHMADTLDRLVEHHGPASKAVVWEHNTLCFFDDSRTVQPLHLEPTSPRGEPDTYPSGR